MAQRRSQGRAGGRWREIEENPTGRGLDGRRWGGAYGIRRKNERSLRAGVRELEGGQGGLWGVLRGKGNKKWLREKEKRDWNIGRETKEEEPYMEKQQAGAGAARYAKMIPGGRCSAAPSPASIFSLASRSSRLHPSSQPLPSQHHASGNLRQQGG